MRKFLIFILILLVLAGGAAIFGMSYYSKSIEAVDPTDTTDVVVEIPQGSGAYTIITLLDASGLVNDELCAKVFVKLNEFSTLQANTYVLNKSMSLEEIFNIINTGDFNYIMKAKFTVIEGSRLTEVAKSMAEDLGFKKKEILKLWKDQEYLKKLIDQYWFLTDEILEKGIKYPLEGYLYPDTYYITGEPSIEAATEICLDMMDKKLKERKEGIEKTAGSVHEFLSFASVVQDESLFAKDRPIIAGVFKNRLDQGIPLQSDSTVLYALGKRHIDVTYQELETDSKYNTYKYKGIPLGPICCVLSDTMDDVIDSTPSDYLYFFACEDGTVLYAETLDEHNKNIKDNLWY